MNIILPVHHFPPRYTAGAELYTLRLARWLQAHGHAVEVICIEAIDAGSTHTAQATHDEYQGISVWRLSFDLLRAPERRHWDYDNALVGAWFRAHLQTHRPDLAHFQAGYLMGVAPLNATLDAGVPTVLTLHDYWYLCPRHTLLRGDGSLCELIPADPAACAWCMKLVSRRYRLADQFSFGFVGLVAQQLALNTERARFADRRVQLQAALTRPQAVIAPSQYLAQRFAAFVSPERLHISPYGLELTPFVNRQRVTMDDAVLRIGFIGQIAPHKGVHLLIEAFRQLRAANRQFELHIHGGLEAFPAYVRDLRAMSNEDARIQWHGRFDNARVAEILSRFSVSVVPSIWYENRPLAILEAQAAGIPVITARLGGMAELVRDEVDGLRFTAGDTADLARQLQHLLDDPALLPRLRAGVTMPRSIDDEMQQLTHIYQRVLASPQD
jgi:glycosyltransferase involved in cell wall biosynthesis